MTTLKVKSTHHWFSDSGLVIELQTAVNGEKTIRLNDKLFDPTDPGDISTLFMFTGTNKNDIYYLEDEAEILEIQKKLSQKWRDLQEKGEKELRETYEKEETALHEKYAQKRRAIRKWIDSFPIKPGIIGRAHV